MAARTSTTSTITSTTSRDDLFALFQAFLTANAPAKVTPARTVATSKRCKGTTVEGARCKRLTTTKFCPAHAQASTSKPAATPKAPKAQPTTHVLTRARLKDLKAQGIIPAGLTRAQVLEQGLVEGFVAPSGAMRQAMHDRTLTSK